MKIYIKSDGRKFRFWLPTRLIFCSTAARIANTMGRKYAPEAMEGIPEPALEALCAELKKVKKRYGKWDLVKAESSNGDVVEIIL